jgi:iron complex transport system substrate-binding protein
MQRWPAALLYGIGLAVAMAAARAAGGAALPGVASTNVCADALALTLADDAQLLSVSARARDPRVSPRPERARRFPANRGTAEEILALGPSIALVSGRWPGRRQAALFARRGVALAVVPYPLGWDEVFESTRRVGGWLGREAAAEAIVADVRRRLRRLQETPRPYKVLHVRPNGRCAGKGTQVDMVLRAAGVRNHATALGCVGWGHAPLEKLLADPPDIFVVADGERGDAAYARSFHARHPLMRHLMASRPVVRVSSAHWGCSNWLLIEAAEEIAARIDRLGEERP